MEVLVFTLAGSFPLLLLSSAVKLITNLVLFLIAPCSFGQQAACAFLILRLEHGLLQAIREKILFMRMVIDKCLRRS